MTIKPKIYSILFLLLLIFSGCSNEKDAYFAEPSWLEKSLYEVLQAEGNFTKYLACIDRTQYSALFKGGGLYTVFAPNDAAFDAYLAKKNYSSVDAIPIEEVEAIISYSMVFAKWKSENLGSLFADQNEYIPGQAYKRKTNYYEQIYRDPNFNNNWVIDQNSVIGSSEDYYNYKYIPVFTQPYLSFKSMTPEDYNVFFPGTEYVGNQTHANGPLANVYDGQIVKPNIITRNGIIHEVSTVNYPLDNMEKVLREESKFNNFRELLDFKSLSNEFVFKSYTESQFNTELYKKLKPNSGIDKVYVKRYNSPEHLYFSPAFEIFDGSPLLTETDGHTMFVPENNALNDYINNKLLKYYDNLHDLPLEAISTLINTHMAYGTIWPSAFKEAQVSTSEYINGEGGSGSDFSNFGVIGQRMASNGLIYNIDHVIKSKLFETVYGEIFLNPDFTLLNSAFVKFYNNSLREDLMKSSLTGHSANRYTLLIPSNAQLSEDGFEYNSLNNTFTNDKIVTELVDTRLTRLMRMHILEGYKSDAVDSEVATFDTQGPTEYGGWNYRTTYYGDLIRYKNNQLQTSGNVDENTFVNATLVESTVNGNVYSIDRMLQYSTRETTPDDVTGWKQKSLWYYLRLAAIENSNVSTFVQYIEAALKDPDTDELMGINEESFYTVLMVNNARMNTAINNGDLPPLAELANDPLAVEKAAAFIRSHFLQGKVYPDDRLTYIYPYNVAEPNRSIAGTMYRINDDAQGLVNQRTTVVVTKNANGTLNFQPQDVVVNGQTLVVGSMGAANQRIITGTAAGNNGYRSNRFAGKSVLHEFYSYFKFVVQPAN